MADVTGVPTQACFPCLAIVLDACSRRIIGRAMGDTRKTQIGIDAMNVATMQRAPDRVGYLGDAGPQ